MQRQRHAAHGGVVEGVQRDAVDAVQAQRPGGERDQRHRPPREPLARARARLPAVVEARRPSASHRRGGGLAGRLSLHPAPARPRLGGRSSLLERSRSGEIPRREASARSSSSSAQRSGSSRSLVLAAGALQRHAAGVLADLADRPQLVGGSCTPRSSAASSARLSSIGRARRAPLLDQRRRHAAHAGLREVPGASELQHRQAVALGVGAQQLELAPAVRDPAHGGGSGGGRTRRTRGRRARRRERARRSPPRA